MAKKTKAGVKKKGKKPDVRAMIRALSDEQILKALDLINGDGHSIKYTRALIEVCGWPEELANAVSKEIESDTSDPKSTIFDKDGNIVEKCYGWYTLSVLMAIASALDVEYRGTIGRGFQARAIDEALREHFKKKEEVTNDVE